MSLSSGTCDVWVVGPVAEHGVVPINYANPNVIVRDADGSVTGVSDVMSPWSLAIAQA